MNKRLIVKRIFLLESSLLISTALRERLAPPKCKALSTTDWLIHARIVGENPEIHCGCRRNCLYIFSGLRAKRWIGWWHRRNILMGQKMWYSKGSNKQTNNWGRLNEPVIESLWVVCTKKPSPCPCLYTHWHDTELNFTLVISYNPKTNAHHYNLSGFQNPLDFESRFSKATVNSNQASF